jgi:hypothetical protein
MNKNKILFLLTICMVGFSACIPGPPNPGFRVKTTRTTIVSGSPLPQTISAPGIGVTGSVLSVQCCVQISGTVGAFNGVTNGNAYYDVNGGKTPATWRFSEHSGPCGGQSVDGFILFGGSTQPLDCRDIPITFFNFLPSMIQRDYPPSTITIDGTGINSQGGMPTVEYYDLNGTLVAQNTASGVASGGNSLTAPSPNLSAFGSGAYIALVRNADGNSPGNGVVVIFDYYEPPWNPPPDPESCGEDRICPVEDNY